MLIPPVAALQAWRHRRGAKKPILVLLATSGGAYRATFWTSLLVDWLVARSGRDGPWPGLAGDIRLVTGASGGMVAGAYLAAMAAEGTLEEGISRRIAADTRARMGAPDGSPRNQPIARDSLTPVVRQLITRDLFHLLRPGKVEYDRGRTLDAEWPTLARSFADIAPSERVGIAPSIIFSPFLVESGQVALFSNLDLLTIRRIKLETGTTVSTAEPWSTEILKEFEGTQESVKLATAVRLNATFPDVSPAISLATRPSRRLVDAGYFDNYGINVLTAYMSEQSVLNFCTEYCAAVVFIQALAFPFEQLDPITTRIARTVQFLTSPFEGLVSANSARAFSDQSGS